MPISEYYALGVEFQMRILAVRSSLVLFTMVPSTTYSVVL